MSSTFTHRQTPSDGLMNGSVFDAVIVSVNILLNILITLSAAYAANPRQFPTTESDSRPKILMFGQPATVHHRIPTTTEVPQSDKQGSGGPHHAKKGSGEPS